MAGVLFSGLFLLFFKKCLAGVMNYRLSIINNIHHFNDDNKLLYIDNDGKTKVFLKSICLLFELAL